MTGFTPETEACLACHPSQKDVEPMTPVDEAVERVRAYVEVRTKACLGDGLLIENYSGRFLYLGDLRALLSALELGRHLAKDALPGGETHPSRPYRTDPLKLAGRLERYAAAIEHDFSKSDLWADLICARDALKDSALSASTPDSGRLDAEAGGWRLVPVYPTEEMRVAGEHAWMNRNLRDPASEPIRDCYVAMVKAAPAPPTGEGGGL